MEESTQELETKRCTHCKKHKAKNCFGTLRRSKNGVNGGVKYCPSRDGLKYWCKDCHNAYGTVHRKQVPAKPRKPTEKRRKGKKYGGYTPSANRRFDEKLRCRIGEALRLFGVEKDRPLLDYLECSVDDLKNQVNRKLAPHGFQWQDFKYWSHDHICPIEQARSKEELMKLLTGKNIQPLLRYPLEQNKSKGGRATPEAMVACFNLLGRGMIERPRTQKPSPIKPLGPYLLNLTQQSMD